jgi:hypothetical protein
MIHDTTKPHELHDLHELPNKIGGRRPAQALPGAAGSTVSLRSCTSISLSIIRRKTRTHSMPSVRFRARPNRTKSSCSAVILTVGKGGTGATDNGTGSSVAMEAVGILATLQKASLLKPMARTDRVALWGGEEEGVYGSTACLQQQFAQRTTMVKTRK